MNLIQRPRRLRNGSVLRSMVRETRISADTLIYPMFVMEGTNLKEEIATMPGQYRWSIDRMDEILQELTDGCTVRYDGWQSGKNPCNLRRKWI